MKNKILYSVIALLLIIIAGTTYYLYDKSQEVVEEGNIEEVKVVEEITDQDEIDNTNNQEATNLVAVGSFVGKGTGTATRIFNEKFVHTVTAEIPSPQTGKFYEGWLVKGSQFFSTGRMILKDGSYYLEYTNPKDQSTYNEVVITQETEVNGLDGVPELHVLEGKF